MLKELQIQRETRQAPHRKRGIPQTGIAISFKIKSWNQKCLIQLSLRTKVYVTYVDKNTKKEFRNYMIHGQQQAYVEIDN